MERIVYIYQLIDPTTMQVRYIGKTVTKLSDRLKVHLHQSKKAKRHTYKEAWIKGLMNRGLKPVIELIEECNSFNWVEREKYWIGYARQNDWPITNLSEGGDGFHGVRHTESWKRNLSERMKGNKLGVGKKWSDEQRAKMHRVAWNKGNRGGKHSDETKAKMSASKTGQTWLGKKWSEEAKLKFKEAHARGWATRKEKKKSICVH